ncbi:hypothetical protein FOCC_FOCC005408 [Frankliniella occidentalis]|nr:hypothetical protein FOCC_FOCC005408 [Frankliniella occidentalis]
MSSLLPTDLKRIYLRRQCTKRSLLITSRSHSSSPERSNIVFCKPLMALQAQRKGQPFKYLSDAAGARAGLRLLHVSVPPVLLRGETASLQCEYELGGDRLYSVQWYKDDDEIYRFVPRAGMQKHSYLVDGVHVDQSRDVKGPAARLFGSINRLWRGSSKVRLLSVAVRGDAAGRHGSGALLVLLVAAALLAS